MIQAAPVLLFPVTSERHRQWNALLAFSLRCCTVSLHSLVLVALGSSRFVDGGCYASGSSAQEPSSCATPSFLRAIAAAATILLPLPCHRRHRWHGAPISLAAARPLSAQCYWWCWFLPKEGSPLDLFPLVRSTCFISKKKAANIGKGRSPVGLKRRERDWSFGKIFQF